MSFLRVRVVYTRVCCLIECQEFLVVLSVSLFSVD